MKSKMGPWAHCGEHGAPAITLIQDSAYFQDASLFPWSSRSEKSDRSEVHKLMLMGEGGHRKKKCCCRAQKRTSFNCAWIRGAAVGRRKVNMGNQASKTMCVQQIRIRQPRATGAQYSAEGKGKGCYAVYNWARATGGKNRQTCRFTGCRISKHRVYHRRVVRRRKHRVYHRRVVRKVVRKRRSRPSCNCA